MKKIRLILLSQHLVLLIATFPPSSKQYYKRWGQVTKNIAVGLALVLLYTILSSCSPSFVNQFDMATSEVATTIVPPLSTRGSAIIDARGRVVLLRGVNWFGMELKEHTPHGLWARDYKQMLAQIKSLGYNVIRLPYSVQALRSRDISGVDFYIGSNKDFQGKTPLEVMDIVIQEAQRQGLFILLDGHTLKDGKIPELWYDDDFTEKDWIDTWILLAKRYKNQRNVIGADLKNEPHGRASWGTGDRATDWRLAAERAGNSILSVNPNWLIVVEGVVENVPGQKLSRHWWGGNLEGVRKYPVRLRVSKKLVYSPHEYGGSDLPWFSERTFPKNLYQRWEIGFHYIATQRIAPILIGEFGGPHVDTKSKEGIWQRQLVDFIDKKKLSFTYWCWNPNSEGTGGILLDNWKSINTDKQKLLSQVLR
ncbi:MAG: glycoside hydrolase family 5 protein [Microcoleus sp. SIO2G3]|nr:glycoside hydrolase family 5 protein [Microcoleus sp. SIO2G3]